jgi:hypothetical protein
MNTKLLITFLLISAALLIARNIPRTKADNATTPTKVKKVEYSETGYTIGEDGKFYKPNETADNPQEGY